MTATTADYDYRPAHDHEAAIRVVAPSGRSRVYRLSPMDTAGDKVTRLSRQFIRTARFYLVRRGQPDVEL